LLKQDSRIFRSWGEFHPVWSLCNSTEVWPIRVKIK